ncbi:ABC transporter permease [Vaginisenegalia massiliensis]|uniref:ABC transporter permease n=1 Tax=Vaginisenegalia massiliensis TaxID=2058294 RepID=UPI000F534024|nr:ABC transporter permease [Vaginisenegalia massiliensis]
MSIIISSLTQAMVWAVMAIGVYITFRLLDIADLSAEGAFPLGAATAAVAISSGIHPIIATILAIVSGLIAGLIAGYIHTKLKIPALLTGILVLTGLYSINIHVMKGQPNITLLGKQSIYSLGQAALPILNRNVVIILITGLILFFVILGLVLFLHTEVGLAFRASGDNDKMSQANGINTNRMKILGYMVGNGLIALSGALVAQKDGFADIGMGIGTIVIGLASIIVAEVVLPHTSIGVRLSSIIVGSFIYRLIIDVLLNQPFILISPGDLRLFSAIILLVVLCLPDLNKRKA